MRTRFILALPSLLAFAACAALMQVQRYDRPRVMLCTKPLTLNDATSFELPIGLINPGDTVRILGSVVRLGSPTDKYLVRVGERTGGIDGLAELADPSGLASQAILEQIPSPARIEGTDNATPGTGKTSRTTDPQIGTDEKGRPLYQGPQGGIYYLNANGNKTYVTKKYKKK